MGDKRAQGAVSQRNWGWGCALHRGAGGEMCSSAHDASPATRSPSSPSSKALLAALTPLAEISQHPSCRASSALQ